MLATILDTSPKLMLGLRPLMDACLSLKNKAYADTGLVGSLGSFFFFRLDGLGFLTGWMGSPEVSCCQGSVPDCLGAGQVVTLD